MRKVYFLFPQMEWNTGGHTAQVKFMEIAQSFCDAQPVTYKKRVQGVPFLDDVLTNDVSNESIFIIHWGYHIKGLVKRLAGKNVVYLAHSTGDPFTLPPSIPIICVSRHTQAYWGRYAPNSLIYCLPNVISDEFKNRGIARSIDVLVQKRKTSKYLIEELVPALEPHCRVVVSDSWVSDLSELFNQSKIYLYDSVDHWNEKGITEGFGLPPLEAMACGCTVFSTVNDALSDYLDPGFNSFKLRVHSKMYDMNRILEAAQNWQETDVHPEHMSHYHKETIQKRFEAILSEIDQFFDFIRNHKADIPMLKQQNLLNKRPSAVAFATLQDIVPLSVKQNLKRLLSVTDS